MLTKTVRGQRVRKASASGAGNDCVYLPTRGSGISFVHDSKAEAELTVPAGALAALLRATINW